MRIDHLVLATNDLARTVASFAARSGITPIRGGQHLGLGTRNELCALGEGAYLEIIGPDASQPPPSRPRPFGIDELVGERLVAWCASYEGPIEAASTAWQSMGHSLGAILPMSRRRPDGVLLSWKLTFPCLTGHFAHALPFFIDWLDSEHPTRTLPPSLTLRSLRISSPHSEDLMKALASVGSSLESRLSVIQGDQPLLTALIQTPLGEISLSG